MIDSPESVARCPSDRGKPSALERAKTQWLFGDWQNLARVDMDTVSTDPDRSRLALLVASAHQQLGQHDEARRCTRLALDWGCSVDAVARVLIAAVHNSLGRAAALKQDERRLGKHFTAAIAAIGTNDAGLIRHVRTVREMTNMGLLPQAASLLDSEVKAVKLDELSPARIGHHLRIMQTEVELLKHELSLAQQRSQLLPRQQSVMPLSSAVLDDSSGRMLRRKSMSQLGQDLWVLEKTGYKRNGFFVEFGATDGVLLSNTYLLEKEFAWEGICAEPNLRFFEQLRENRTCRVSNACIGKKSGERVEFVLADAYGGMTRHIQSDMHHIKRQAYLSAGEAVILTTVSLHDFLTQQAAPRTIDYLSIDTEGSEYEILSHFPFANWDIKLITVEHNFGEQREKIRFLLSQFGYSRRKAEWDDWYYKELDS